MERELTFNALSGHFWEAHRSGPLGVCVGCAFWKVFGTFWMVLGGFGRFFWRCCAMFKMFLEGFERFVKVLKIVWKAS